MVSSADRDRQSKGEAVKELLIEATRLHFHVASFSREVAGPYDLTNAQVSILRSLASMNSATVPELARERAIARQPVQRMVLDLVDEGLVELAENPAHRRSRLIRLTPKGRRRLVSMERRQSALASGIGNHASEAAIRRASRLLGQLRAEITNSSTEPE